MNVFEKYKVKIYTYIKTEKVENSNLIIQIKNSNLKNKQTNNQKQKEGNKKEKGKNQ